MAVRLQTRTAMGKHDRAKKDVKRLELRREVIRVLASESLAMVHGGEVAQCVGTKGSICWYSKIPPP
jgi:hypothetical protein